MPDWKQIIATNHLNTHADDEFDLITRPPAGKEELSDLAVQLGVRLPSELEDIYSVYDGFGVRSNNFPDHDYWFLVPVDRVPAFADEIRSWFRGTHPDLAARFVPCFDFANGDAMGYLFDTEGNPEEGLYGFSHEEYERDEDQDPDEFLAPIGIGIEQFLTHR